MKLTQKAKRVFKGLVHDVYQWEQEMFDGTTDIFEALKRPDGVQIIPTVGDKILLAYERQPLRDRTFTFFGGRCEEGEEPLESAKRELLEETGLGSDEWQLLKTYPDEGKIDWSTFLFVARNCQKAAEPTLDAGEDIQVKEMSFEEFLETVSSENFWGRTIANDILRSRLSKDKTEDLRKKIFG